jgi:hypothetical protein
MMRLGFILSDNATQLPLSIIIGLGQIGPSNIKYSQLLYLSRVLSGRDIFQIPPRLNVGGNAVEAKIPTEFISPERKIYGKCFKIYY